MNLKNICGALGFSVELGSIVYRQSDLLRLGYMKRTRSGHDCLMVSNRMGEALSMKASCAAVAERMMGTSCDGVAVLS